MPHRGRSFFAGTFLAIALGLGAALGSFSAGAEEQSEVQIWRLIIRESIAAYPRECPCPYSATRSGNRCGERSAYRRGSRHSPMCYPHDIPDEEIEIYRERIAHLAR